MNTIALNHYGFEKRIMEIYNEEQLKILEERWNKLSKSDRLFIVGFLNEISPNRKKNLNEAWYNTLGDVVGIFDPTGIVDGVNAVSYFSQGETLFGILSLISAIPYVGDVVAKPIVGALKAGGTAFKALKGAKTANRFAALARRSPKIANLMGTLSKWAEKIVTIIQKVPGGKKFTNTVTNWIDMVKGAKAVKSGGMISKSKGLLATDIKVFRDFGMKDYSGLMRVWKKGGFLKNRQLSKHLAKTKFWLGFLDFVGVANFIGPEEIENDPELGNLVNEEMEEYLKTNQAKNNWEQDMNSAPSTETETGTETSEPTTATNKPSISQDPLFGFLFS